MSRSHVLTQDEFDRLLDWLDSDRRRAGEKYESIRHNLIKLFTWQGANDAEDLADETINRVAFRVKDLMTTYEGEPALFFYGVAKHLMHEVRRARRQRVPLDALGSLAVDADAPDPETEILAEAFDKCLNKLAADERNLLLNYYRKSGMEKIHHRKAIAEEHGLRQGALRARVFRLRAALQRCVEKELAKSVGGREGR